MRMCIVTVARKAVPWRTRVAAEPGQEGGEPRNALEKYKHNDFMRLPNQLTRNARLLTVAVVAGACVVMSANLRAAEPKEGQPKPAFAQRLFASPEEAIQALKAASQAKDKTALRDLFGPLVDELLTGDEVQDANNAQRFATVIAQGCKPMNEGADKITLEIGTNNWPMSIPLVRADGQWRFDTAAGREEIINRHIGKDELHAIGVCRAYVTAQRQYAAANPDASGAVKYALKFKSTPGKKDGLYWPAADNEPASPFGPLVAEAHAEGYIDHKKGSGPHPFHGYYFRILTRQGKAAPGGEINYLSHGNLTGGFALVAFPEVWDQSGIMTFIVNQDGQVYQRNLGENTLRVARRMKEYNPDVTWTLVRDDGVLSAASEKRGD